ncbi:MAG: DUF3489 domain-containing protein [Alphaproteobacteria bacterium]
MSKSKHSTKSPRPIDAKKTRSAGLKAGKTKRSSASTKPDPQARAGTKQATLIDLMCRPGGATLADLVKATGWQPHSVRGAISGALKKKLGLPVTSESTEKRGRVYRIAG